MKIRVDRREVLVGAAALACCGPTLMAGESGVGARAMAGAAKSETAPTSASGHDGAARQLAALEKREGGRLGVEALDTATGRRLQHRSDERFGMCSVFKFIAAAAILKRVDQGTEHLERRIEYSAGDLLEYAPVTREHVGAGGLTLGELCAAAVQWSDNTAANLMLKVLGGPEVVTTFIRSTGDQITRLNRIEPDLNVVHPGDLDDTTTATSMVGLLNSIVLGNALSADSRTRRDEGP